MRGKNKYYVQITFEGIPPEKHKLDKNEKVGINIGTSAIAIAGNDEFQYQ